MFRKALRNILNKTSIHSVLKPQNSMKMSKKYEVLYYDEEVLVKTLLLKLKFNGVLSSDLPGWLVEFSKGFPLLLIGLTTIEPI